MDAIEAHKRISQRRTGDPDRMEEQPAEFYEAVRRGYLDRRRTVQTGFAFGCVQTGRDIARRSRNAALSCHFQRKPLERLNEARRAGRLAHAYLLTGPVGSGKSWLAERIAAALWSVHRNA